MHTIIRQLQYQSCACLGEWVGSSAPVCEEQAKADGLEDSGKDADSDGIQRSLLSDNGGDNLEHLIS